MEDKVMEVIYYIHQFKIIVMAQCLTTHLKQSVVTDYKYNTLTIDVHVVYETGGYIIMYSAWTPVTIFSPTLTFSTDLNGEYSNTIISEKNIKIYVKTTDTKAIHKIYVSNKYSLNVISLSNIVQPGTDIYYNIQWCDKLTYFFPSSTIWLQNKPLSLTYLANKPSLITLYINTFNYDVNLTDIGVTSVVVLNFMNNTIQGTFDEFITCFPNLASINMLGNRLIGEWSTLAKLSALYNLIINTPTTWSSTTLRDNAYPIILGTLCFKTASDVDNFLINMANCVYKTGSTLKLNIARTSASDEAVKVLENYGITITMPNNTNS